MPRSGSAPNFRTAFEAWQATNPETKPAAPAGPTYVPQYRQPAKARAAAVNAQATKDYAAGEKAGSNSDDYVGTTVFLATVLFLAGIGSHFGTTGPSATVWPVCSWILLFAIALLATAPKPSPEQPNRRKAHSVISSQEKRSNLARTLGLTK